MSPAAIEQQTAQNGTSNGAAEVQNTSQDFVSTEPGPDFDWKISLRNKVIAITGANRGIGLALAEVCFANDAAEIYSLDLFEPGEEFEALAKQHPKKFHYINCDVTKEANVYGVVDKIVEQSGRIDGMIANAGMTKHQPALNFDTAQLEQMFNLNVFGAYYCAKAAAQKFIDLGIKGSIVFTASMTSYRPNRAGPSAPYGGTKAAVRNMAHTLAMEWAKHGIRVNAISPGFMRTQMTRKIESAPDFALKMQYYGGMPRMADRREVGGAYVYLLSDSASYTSGIDIPIAGIVGAW